MKIECSGPNGETFECEWEFRASGTAKDLMSLCESENKFQRDAAQKVLETWCAMIAAPSGKECNHEMTGEFGPERECAICGVTESALRGAPDYKAMWDELTGYLKSQMAHGRDYAMSVLMKMRFIAETQPPQSSTPSWKQEYLERVKLMLSTIPDEPLTLNEAELKYGKALAEKIKSSTPQVCPKCNGKRYQMSSEPRNLNAVPCGECNGTGKAPQVERDFTPEEALAEARKRWKYSGFVALETDTGGKLVCMVGWSNDEDSQVCGTGFTFKAAFAAADAAQKGEGK